MYLSKFYKYQQIMIDDKYIWNNTIKRNKKNGIIEWWGHFFEGLGQNSCILLVKIVKNGMKMLM